MTVGLTAAMIEDEATLGALAPEWWRLWQRSDRATPFQSPGWLMAWWRAFSPGGLLTAAVRIGGRLAGLAPFYIERQGGRARILPIGISISDYLDVLIDPDMRGPVLASICKTYDGHAERWAEWEMTELPPGAVALEIPVPRNCETTESVTVPCPVLSLDASPCTLDDALPVRTRRKLRMTRHRLDRHGGAAILSAGDRDPDWWIAQLHRLHSARWSSKGEAGLLRDRRLEAFHKDVMHEFAARGLVRLYALTLGDSVAGIYYGFHHRGRAYAYLGGFDPAYSYYSPGTFLMAHAISEALTEGAREFHFLRGGEAYKYAWGATDRWNRRRVLRRRG